MPKKTLALIVGLVLVTVVLFVFALRASNTSDQTAIQPTPAGEAPAPTSAAKSILTLSPNPVTVGSGQSGQVSVEINTDSNEVTGVQLEISYDPGLISNVKVTPGVLLPNAAVLFDNNNSQTGNYTYALGITPNSPTIQGTGSVAVITFTARGIAGSQSQIELLPTTLISAKGVRDSVLKQSSGATVIINAASTTNTGSGSGTFVETAPPVVAQ